VPFRKNHNREDALVVSCYLIANFLIDPGKISLSSTKIIMELPRLNGFTTDSRPYELTARTAAQDLAKPDIMELNDISALVELKDGQQVNQVDQWGLRHQKRIIEGK
jgi:hypothetical protein